jgi:P4 family phage/plasmid primase-like protien
MTEFNFINNTDQFDDFIKSKIVEGKGVEYTHTDCGPPFKKYYIEDKSLEEFYEKYNKILGFRNIHLTEKPKSVSPLTVDIDFKFDSKNSNRQYKLKDVKYLINVYIKIINNNLKVKKSNSRSFFFEKDKPTHEVKKNEYKDGFHIIFPDIAMNKMMKYIITHEVKEYVIKEDGFKEIPFINSIDDVFDVCVLSRNNWCMYGSKKFNGSLYKLKNIFKWNLKDVSLDKYNKNDLVKILAVRKFKEEDVSKLNKNMNDIIWNQKIECVSKKYNLSKSKNKNKNTKSLDENIKKKDNYQLIDKDEYPNSDESYYKKDDTNYDEAKKLIKLLSKKRAVNYNSWIHVIWCLRNIDTRLFSEALEFSKKDMSKYDYNSCKKIWDNSEETSNGFNIPSLRNWAKEDNLKEYQKLIDESVNLLIQEAESGTHYDIAKLMYKLYRHVYRCSDIKHGIWYEYNSRKHGWVEVDAGYTLNILLSEDLCKRFANLNAYYWSKSTSNGLNGFEADALQKKADKISKLIKELKKNNFKAQVLAQCANLFYEKDFEEKLDSNRDLIRFDNGVYDLKTGMFRKGSPDDYLTFGVNYNFPKNMSYDHPHIKDIQDYFEKIQTEHDMREYILTLLSTYLDGHITEQKFIIWTGVGANGKSTTVELLQAAMGDYFGSIPITLLTKKRGGSSAASPELSSTRGKRFVVFQEPEKNDQIHVGYMKELTGGDTILARPLYKNPVRFKPQFKLLLTCNNLPGIPSSDKGTWRRLRVTPFETEFVDSDPEGVKQFLKDKHLYKKLVKWKEAFMWLLLKKYYPLYKKNGLKEPKKVTKFTDKYKMDSDIYLEFMHENLVVTEKNKDYESISMVYTTFKSWYRESYATNSCPSKKELKEYFFTRNFKIKENKIFGIKFFVDEKPLMADLDDM